MPSLAITLLLVAALGGTALVAIRARTGANPPFLLAIVHGVAAAAGLVIATTVATGSGAGRVAMAGVGVLGVAAVAGAMVFFSHARGRAISVPGSIAHAALAIAGVAIFVWAVVSGNA